MVAAVAGMASHRWGRKTIVTFTLVLYGLASAVSGLAPNFYILLLFRFLTGLGSGGELPVTPIRQKFIPPMREEVEQVGQKQ